MGKTERFVSDWCRERGWSYDCYLGGFIVKAAWKLTEEDRVYRCDYWISSTEPVVAVKEGLWRFEQQIKGYIYENIERVML